MKLLAYLFRVARNVFTSPTFRARFYYLHAVSSLDLDDSSVLIESFHGDDINGAPFYILDELCRNPKYAGLTKHVVANKASERAISSLLNSQFGNRSDVVLVRKNGRRYCRLLASAKYLVTNVSFPTYFVKRPGQVYMNTWHGTPLKALGKRVKNAPNEIGNVQRNLIMSDYLLCPSEFVANVFRHDYMIDIFYGGTYLYAGYPQNAALLSPVQTKESLSAATGASLAGKRVVAYMPTWRDEGPDCTFEDLAARLNQTLRDFDSKLDDDTIVLAKPHHMAAASIDWSSFSKVLPFPPGFETYQVLSVADVLVTDYSSVMFDFLNTRKPIFLYTYDEAAYQNGRSMYHTVDELTFWHTESIDELCLKISGLGEGDCDYQDYRERYCLYDSVDASATLCNVLIDGDLSKVKAVRGEDFHNDRKNVLIFAGALRKNGMTSSLKGLLSTIDREAANYVLLFYTNSVRENIQFLNTLPEGVRYVPIQARENMTLSEAFACALYFKFGQSNAWIMGRLASMFERERNRVFPGYGFDTVIHFTGYDRRPIFLFNAFDQAKKVIFVHNDMEQEYKRGKNFDRNALMLAYRDWDVIAVVNEPLIKPLVDFFRVDSSKIRVVHNCNDLDGIRQGGRLPLQFDEDTVSSVPQEELSGMIEGKTGPLFINVGRFAPEKGQIRLMDAFLRFNREVSPESRLIILGGYGPEYDAVAAHLEELDTDAIVLILSLSNPYPLIAQSDALVLSSFYEGLPMVIFEALALGTPVISTDIVGPRAFLEQGYGLLVENSEEGLYEGMRRCADGDLGDVDFDLDAFNERSAREFEELVS